MSQPRACKRVSGGGGSGVFAAQEAMMIARTREPAVATARMTDSSLLAPLFRPDGAADRYHRAIRQAGS
jgi:hypothetical protein